MTDHRTPDPKPANPSYPTKPETDRERTERIAREEANQSAERKPNPR